MFFLERYLSPNIRPYFWTPCVAYYIDMMLRDIGKVEWVKNIFEHAKCIKKYIYNHSWVLSLIRKNIGAKELIRPAITRFATHFLMLQSLNSQQKKLAENVFF